MENSDRATANSRVVRRLLFAAVAMFGFGFALVPLYDVFCDITGINGKTGRIELEAALSQKVDQERTVTVEFLSSVRSDLAWDFKPVVKRVKVHPGEVTEVNYMARNKTGEVVAGQAVPSLAPGLAATLGPNEEKLMPLRFVVDPGLPEEIGTVSLSYTFFQAESGAPAGKQAGMIEELQDTAGTASGAQL
jgi:cytochrome c oxidase assembly protein subunit 11